MTFFTGDIHGSPWGIKEFCEKMSLTEKDIVIILGDVAANYYGDQRDEMMKAVLNSLKATILCIHGNHEQRPETIDSYELKEWNGGMVWVQPGYQNLLFARDGDIFTIDGIRYIVIGRAYSVDKFYRINRGYGWWANEQPSDETKTYVEKQISENSFDVILSHTCPYKYEPTEMFLPMIDQANVDTSTEEWLNQVEEKADYIAWFCGHWHTDKHIDKMHFLFHSFESDEQLKIKKEKTQ